MEENEIICLDCKSNPCLCEREPEETMGYEPPCMIEPDFYNCESCGVEIRVESICNNCDKWEDPENIGEQIDEWQETTD